MNYEDRFILNRNKFDVEKCHEKYFSRNVDSNKDKRPILNHYTEQLNSILLDDYKSVLPFNSTKIDKKKIPIKKSYNSKPVRILDAVGYLDDFYLHLADWSVDNVIAVALGKSLYMIIAETFECLNFFDCNCNITALKWSNDGKMIAFGNSKGELKVVNFEEEKLIFNKKISAARITCISWNQDLITLVTQSNIFILNIREKYSYNFKAHEQEICSIEWNYRNGLLASGGNDNMVHIWDMKKNMDEPLYTISNHISAVKGIAWSPKESDVIASGGGCADKKIIITNLSTKKENIIDTKSQITSLIWDEKHPEEIISSHGFTDKAIKLWDINTKSKLLHLSCHSQRILKMVKNPLNDMFASISPDDLFVVWDIYNKKYEIEKNNFPKFTIR